MDAARNGWMDALLWNLDIHGTWRFEMAFWV
jgi:hypothetical protein